jgi:hypothetical protein
MLLVIQNLYYEYKRASILNGELSNGKWRVKDGGNTIGSELAPGLWNSEFWGIVWSWVLYMMVACEW